MLLYFKYPASVPSPRIRTGRGGEGTPMYCKTNTTDKSMGRHSRGGERREETSGEGQRRGGPGSAPAGSDPGPGRGGGRRRCALPPAGVALRRGPRARIFVYLYPPCDRGSAPAHITFSTRSVTSLCLAFPGKPAEEMGSCWVYSRPPPVCSPQPR